MANDTRCTPLPHRDDVLPPPRDPDIAVREEFELARAQATRAALELFVERHADHPLAAEARRLLGSL